MEVLLFINQWSYMPFKQSLMLQSNMTYLCYQHQAVNSCMCTIRVKILTENREIPNIYKCRVGKFAVGIGKVSLLML